MDERRDDWFKPRTRPVTTALQGVGLVVVGAAILFWGWVAWRVWRWLS